MEKFIELILKEVNDILGERYSAIYLEAEKKNNVSFPSLAIIDNTKGSCTTPSIYLQKYYEMYKNGENLYYIARLIVDCYKNIEPKEFDITSFMDFDVVKNYICYELVNTKENTELLKKIPHREFLDLSICYYVKIDNFIEQGDFAGITITNEHLEILWHVSEEDLYNLASINTPKLLGQRIEILGMILREQGMLHFPCMTNDLYILSNKYFIRGSSVVLYTDILKKFANLFEKSFWLIPSSTNEWLIVIDNNEMSYEDYFEMISFINKDELPQEEVLGTHPYYFNKETMQITMNKED